MCSISWLIIVLEFVDLICPLQLIIAVSKLFWLIVWVVVHCSNKGILSFSLIIFFRCDDKWEVMVSIWISRYPVLFEERELTCVRTIVFANIFWPSVILIDLSSCVLRLNVLVNCRVTIDCIYCFWLPIYSLIKGEFKVCCVLVDIGCAIIKEDCKTWYALVVLNSETWRIRHTQLIILLCLIVLNIEKGFGYWQTGYRLDKKGRYKRDIATQCCSIKRLSHVM